MKLDVPYINGISIHFYILKIRGLRKPTVTAFNFYAPTPDTHPIWVTSIQKGSNNGNLSNIWQ